MAEKYVLGVDFGSDSVRCVLADTAHGCALATASVNYSRWSEGRYCDPKMNQYRQHPKDYVEALERVVGGCLSKVSQQVVDQVVAISFDTTASTPVLTDVAGVPLAMLPEFSENPDAMFVLWKDHTAVKEAEQINRAAELWPVNYLRYSGGTYSCEWVWAKMLHCLRSSPELQAKAYAWVEHCDWVSALLTGNTKPETIARSRCAAGHKAMWHAEWGGLPDADFLEGIDPLFAVFRGHLYVETVPNGQFVGLLAKKWLKRFGINQPVAVGIGAIDCHVGAIGAGIKPGVLVKVVGTSTCDIAVSESAVSVIDGICGQVEGSVLPDYIGYEAGQSAFGDLFAWLGRVIGWEGESDLSSLLARLGEAAASLPKTSDAPLFVDWHNGRRTPHADPLVRGGVLGLTISTSAPDLFAALVESACFGSRAIAEHLRGEGVEVRQIVAVGGIALKSPYVMQTMSDVLQLPIAVSQSEQACALGATICAAVAAGVYPDIETAQRAMSAGVGEVYRPDTALKLFYDARYEAYRSFGCFVGKITANDYFLF